MCEEAVLPNQPAGGEVGKILKLLATQTRDIERGQLFEKFNLLIFREGLDPRLLVKDTDGSQELLSLFFDGWELCTKGRLDVKNEVVANFFKAAYWIKHFTLPQSVLFYDVWPSLRISNAANVFGTPE